MFSFKKQSASLILSRMSSSSRFLTRALFVFPGTHNRANQCPVNEHGCLDVDVCIHMSKLCDGVPDCSDGWDEGPHCRGNDTYKHTQLFLQTL